MNWTVSVETLKLHFMYINIKYLLNFMYLNFPGTCYHANRGLRVFVFFGFFWPYLATCVISVPWPGIELGPQQWKPGILTTRPPGNSRGLRFDSTFFSECYQELFTSLESGIIHQHNTPESATFVAVAFMVILPVCIGTEYFSILSWCLLVYLCLSIYLLKYIYYFITLLFFLFN